MVGQRDTRTSRRRNICLGAAALAAVSACAHSNPGGGNAPEVRLTNLRPTPAGALAPSFLADLRLTNPTGRRVSIDGVTFNLSLGGALLASGVRNQPVSIAPQADEVLTVEARPISHAIVPHLFALGGGDGLPYAISGEVYSRHSRGGGATMPYASAGTLDLFAGGLTGGEPHYRTLPF